VSATRQPAPSPIRQPAPSQTRQVIPTAPRQVTLLDVLDRLLGGGVIVQGKVMLAAANIDLVELDLSILLGAIDKLRPGQRSQSSDANTQLSPIEHRPTPRLPRRLNTEHEDLEKGLAQLVLTVIELLRQLMERQALRRIDSETLNEAEVERLGRTFMALAERMEELKEVFGFEDEDLNLNLGPLGDLI
jgi:hypothetical protein